MAAIDFIYFDLGNVILNFSHQLACQQMAAVAKIPVEQVHQVVLSGKTELQVRYETGEIDSQQFHIEFCRITKSNPSQDELLLAFSDIFVLNQQIVPLISKLVSVNFPIGILSNTCLAHWQFILENYALVKECFPVKILSFEAGAMKPDQVIYQAAVQQAGNDPSRIFFTDDKPENVAGAIAAGMDAVLFQSTVALANELQIRGLDVF